MDSSVVEFAKILKGDNKKESSNANYVIGKVISPLPNLKISEGSYIILDREDLIITESFQRNINIKTNDSVLMIPSSDNQKYIVIDKVVRL